MDPGHQELLPGAPVDNENISDEYPLSFRGQRGTIRTKNERLTGGSTADVRRGIFMPRDPTETNPETKPIAFKVYKPEPLGPAVDDPWWVGPAEAGILSANIPGIARVYEWGWMHGGSGGEYLNGTLNPSNTPVDTYSYGTILPSQFAIAIEYLDPVKYIHPEELWSIARQGLEVDRYASLTIEGVERIAELMQPHDLLEKGFYHPGEFGEDLIISAAWTYFNTQIELQKAGWSVSDFDLSKNFVFDPDGKQWKLYDFGVANPINEQAIAFCERLLGKDFQRVIDKQRKQVKSDEEMRAANPPNAKQLRTAYLTALGFYCFRKAFQYQLPSAESEGQYRPTGEGLTPKLRKFVEWVWEDESMQSAEDMRDRIGEFIVSEMVGSHARTIVENTVGQGFNLHRELLRKSA